jgi:hypothetical protein
MQSVSQPQRSFPEQARIPSPRGAVPKAHQIFRHARPRQFTASGRKRRITQERDRRTAQALSHFEQGFGVWASRKTILHELQVMEARRDPGDRVTWSLATLKRSLRRLEGSGVERRHGIRHEGRKKWGTRERTLHPERLLPRSESDPSIRSNVNRQSIESEPLEVNDFKTSDSRANSHHPNQNRKHDDDLHLACKDFSKPTRKSQAKPSGERRSNSKPYAQRLAIFLATAKDEILRNDPDLEAEVVDGVLHDVIARAHDAGTIIGSATYLLASFRNSIEADEELEREQRLAVEQREELLRKNEAARRKQTQQLVDAFNARIELEKVEREELERNRRQTDEKFAASFAELTRRGDEYRNQIY